ASSFLSMTTNSPIPKGPPECNGKGMRGKRTGALALARGSGEPARIRLPGVRSCDGRHNLTPIRTVRCSNGRGCKCDLVHKTIEVRTQTRVAPGWPCGPLPSGGCWPVVCLDGSAG